MKTETVARDQAQMNGLNVLPYASVGRSRFGSRLTRDAASVRERMPRGELREREPMSRHVSWRAGGVADRAYEPVDLADLQAFLATRPAGEAICFVGLGSNLLVRDGGFRGTIVFTHWALRAMEIDAGHYEIAAEAGVACPKVARLAAVSGFAGAEFLAGIPGTLGGALAMNAGCYGGETWSFVTRVRTIDRRGELHERTPGQYRVGYRSVVRKGNGESPTPEEWFVAATLRFSRAEGEGARQRIRELLARRLATQPLNQPNAGSVFRNPPGDHAARLIEACGLKGRAVGAAMISPKHANFIVNLGNARARDIEALIELARSTVKERFGIELECEVRVIGERDQ